MGLGSLPTALHPLPSYLVVLLPQVKGLPGLSSVDPGATGHLQELHKADCIKAVRMSLSSTMPEACARLACSISALFKGGGLECCCHTKSATNAICNPVNGQCPCRAGLAGHCCDHCPYGWWGFPCCQTCACNGAAELCYPLTGVCQDCHGATMGQHCERCLDGYYGDPTLGSGQQCRPCLCPGHPGSGISHGTSCHVDSTSGCVLCLCAPGYAGAEAQDCSAALLSQEAMLTAQVVATVGGPDSILGQAQEAWRWTEKLLWGMGRPRGTAVWQLKLKGLVHRAQRLHPQLLQLLVKAGVML
ncbi:laminin subunit beta-1-like [Kogia breviceps]|uniref:laminin subunit beta-1-like n=1 Tax=Kogia breviceps TaxID=27615 RepID=UPI0034D1B6E1